MPCDLMQPKMMNFGIAHTGARDDKSELIPVTVTTNVNYERPEPLPRSSERPAPMPLVLTIRVDGRKLLSGGAKYTLLRYADESKVPFSNFLHAGGEVQTWNFEGQAGKDFVVTLDVMSNEKAMFRCVRAN